MRMKTMTCICATLIAMVIGTSSVWAAKKPAPVRAPVTEKGQKLEAKYAAELKDLKMEIEKDVPEVDEQKKAAYLKARAAEKAATADRNAKRTALGKNRGHTGLLNHRKGWIGRATKGVAEAKVKLKQAETMAGDKNAKAKAVTEAKEALAKIQANYDMAASELKKSQDLVDAAKIEEPKLIKELEAAAEVLVQAQAKTLKAIKELGLNDFLARNQLDDKLTKYVVMLEATPRGLAEFSEKGRGEEKLIGKLLKDDDLMVQMVMADGANDAKYGQAMKIYTDIQKASKKAKDGVLQRLALATALEHAVPRQQRNATALTDAPATVDPVKRYLHFEKAFLEDELDPGFKDLSVWDYRMVVNGEEPEEILSWGREMLRNYRPDHVATDDYRWRYVQAVRTEVRYGSQFNSLDKPELQFFQNIIMNGGVCGRRAFFGRFILRAFGVPTTARPQPGHAALTHWTPDGWVVCLGGGWGVGTTKSRYKKDLDFLATTQARVVKDVYPQVKRAQWIGDALGETQVFGFFAGDPGFWYGVSLYKQREIIAEAKAVALAAIGEDLGEANESETKEAVNEVTVTEEDRKIVAKDGVITIPAVACSSPVVSTAKIKFMDSNLGGKQMHYGRTGAAEDWEYTFETPKAGKYTLSARVVTVTPDQHVLIAANGAKESADMTLPLTVGMWGKSEPVEVALVKGKNVLKCSRAGDNIRGVTIKDFTLTLTSN